MKSVLAAVVAGALLFLAFPPYNHGLLAFVAFVPLLAVLRGKSPLARFVLGWVAGNFAYTAAVFGSILHAAEAYFDHPLWVDAGFAFVAPQIYGALYFGLFALVAGPEIDAPARRRLVTIPAIWVAVELLRARFWHGAPWLLLAHSQHENLRLIQIADVFGASGVAFVVVLVNVFAEYALRVLRHREAWRPAIALASGTALLATLVYGEVQNHRWAGRGGEFRVGIVQPALPGEWRASLTGVPRSLERLRDLSTEVAQASLDLLIWPENALGFGLQGNDDLGHRVAEAAGGAATLLGAPRTVESSDGVHFRNAAFLVAADGSLRAHYDKIRLTPWAEYRPIHLGGFASDGYAPRDPYVPGSELQVFEVAGAHFATMICFEAVYAELARAFVDRGAEFFVNLSNDDWFGNEAAVQQHFVASLFRAVENRRYLVRVTNSGQSGVIDPRGAVVASLARDRPTATVVAIDPIRDRSIYTRWGDVFAWFCVVVMAAVVWRRPPSIGP